MAWMWARLHVRSPKLGYFVGGFQAFIDTLASAVRNRGGEILFSSPVQGIRPGENNQIEVLTVDQTTTFDRVLSTTSPSQLARIAPSLPENYLGQLLNLKSMGAVVLTMALKQPLLTRTNTYWLNIPADSPDKSQSEFPFLALVEHTNYIDRKHYGGDHIVYCGDYVTPDHPYLSMEKNELEDLFASTLSRFNPAFKRDWVRRSWLFRAKYAQPVPVVNHSQNIPDLRTPLPGLYLASMSQVYPWDRGTNYAVEIGRRVARLIMEDV